uniref:CFAP65 fourth Ig-like domain-containing protein n=1 Tax=Myripristis murdjan TaxID=586833 RepID=A0A668AUK1_9TELE
MCTLPTHPIAHHRRVPCLILHMDPVFIDLIGTCHSNLQQPAILRPKHLALNQLHRHHRLTKDRLDLSAMEQDHNKHINQQEACSGGMDPLSSCSPSSSLSPHVTVEPAELVFGHKYCSSLSRSSAFSQYVSITNHTSGKLSLVWTAAEDSPFSVSPSSFDLSPLKSTAFKVTYAPLQMNTLHGAQLECFAFYKVKIEDNPQSKAQHNNPECSLLPVSALSELWRLTPHFPFGPRPVPKPFLGRISVCGAKLWFDPTWRTPNPHPQNHSHCRQS